MAANQEIVLIELRKISAKSENLWVRSGDWTKGESLGDDQSFAELCESIQTIGLINPIAVRPIVNARFEIVRGFRRFAAVKHIAGMSGNKDMVIKCIVKEIDDAEGLRESIADNARAQISGPDLAFALRTMSDLHTEKTGPISDRQIANMVGINPGYVSTLLHIVRNAPKVAKLWRESPVQLSVREMHKIAKLSTEEFQIERYRTLMLKKMDSV